ncbi:I78 family peptidase inhibitor [Neorhizobium sp. T7_12]|uniref:I78 family peptidase inhibitor n=1 Tax=Neorhizobium sp. T7_12 TaxID=2093832 RepID=UPI000CF8DA62|nr:I78 family peptidase inhibitor [Neorhizobium sp. T7_12]
MNTPHQALGILFIGLLPVLLSCNGRTASAVPPQRTCAPTAAQALAGKPRLTDEEVMRLTGATIVRQIRPDQMVTHDFRGNRVTIETDPATGRIVRATCG